MSEKSEASIAVGATAQWTAAVRAIVWLIEGLLFYLPNEQIRRILDEMTRLAAPGSWIGFDIVNSVTLTHPLVHDWIEMQARLGAPWIGTLDEPVEYLAERGWTASLTQAGQPDASYGRWPFPVLPTTMPGVPHNWFVAARRETIS
jgi:O-methyltransferase involved in polyketide biosynthesis